MCVHQKIKKLCVSCHSPLVVIFLLLVSPISRRFRLIKIIKISPSSQVKIKTVHPSPILKTKQKKMAIDSFLGLWTPSNCVVLSILAFITILIGDSFASRFINVTPRFLSTLDNPQTDVHTFFMKSTPTSSSLHALPNFWLWYEAPRIRDALRNQVDSYFEFVLLTVYQATICTVVVGVTCFFISMTFAVRAFFVHERLPRRYFSPLLALFAFLMDFVEDLLLIIIALGFPGTSFPALEVICSWCSLLKWISWFVMLCWWFTMGFMILIRRTKVDNED